jgi:rhodanese-related sulfurtransferase
MTPKRRKTRRSVEQRLHPVGDELKGHLYEEFARVGRAVSSPLRLELLEILAQGERTVEMLAREAGQPFANVSHHLQALRKARLVESQKTGLYVSYRLSDPIVFELCHLIRRLAQSRLAEVDRIVKAYLDGRDELEPVSREALLSRVRAGTVFVLDVRPVEEYQAGHIRGAVSIPLPELKRRVRELPADKEIVAYCRGPYCVMAYRAIEILRSKKRRARRLVDGFPEWKAAGLPVGTSNRRTAK